MFYPLLNLVCFIIKKFVTMHGHLNVQTTVRIHTCLQHECIKWYKRKFDINANIDTLWILSSDFSVKLDGNSIPLYCLRQLFPGMYWPPWQFFHNFDASLCGWLWCIPQSRTVDSFHFPVTTNFNISVPLYDVCLIQLSVAKEIQCLLNAWYSVFCTVTELDNVKWSVQFCSVH